MPRPRCCVESPSVRYYGAAFGERGRVVIDGGLRLSRAQTQVIDTLARLLDAERVGATVSAHR